MEIEVTEFELFLLKEGYRTMKEQVKTSPSKMEERRKPLFGLTG